MKKQKQAPDVQTPKNVQVCCQCGSENVNEERLISSRVNDGTIVHNELISYYCIDCEDVVNIAYDKFIKQLK